MRVLVLALAATSILALGACTGMLSPAQQRALNGAAMGTASGVHPPSAPFENEQDARYYPVQPR